MDSLNNKSVVKREVHVVQKINSTIKQILGEKTLFTGDPDNNYLRLSNILFRIYSLEENNVVIVSEEDIANVNYNKIEEWLNYFYNHLNEKTKKMIIEKNYCQMNLAEEELNTKECTNTTEKMKIYIPSVVDVNKVEEETLNYLKPGTMSWVADKKSNEEAYLTRNTFFDIDMGKDFVPYNIEENYGVRPMMMINGDNLIIGGNGTEDNPYILEDYEKGKGGSLINDRQSGEYISIDGSIYRIVEGLEDGTTRIISNFTVGSLRDEITCFASSDSTKIVYDPKNKTSVAYFINNRVSEYINTKYFTNHEIEVPIYENNIIYKEEKETKKYKVMLSAPNMYEMFSAQPVKDGEALSYWLINSSLKDRTTGAISDIGVPLNQEIPEYASLHIRIIAYLKKGTVITSGKGTYESPYRIQ